MKCLDDQAYIIQDWGLKALFVIENKREKEELYYWVQAGEDSGVPGLFIIKAV